MTKRMLIDATHPEETRVVVLDGQQLAHFDVETAARHLLKGNIYLAKVIRVEPSLQAAFVEYGGGRHGFLAFDEIHPDYYQIPVADRQRLLEEVARQAAEDDDEDPRPKPPRERREQARPLAIESTLVSADVPAEASLPAGEPPAEPPPETPAEPEEPPAPDAPHAPVEEPAEAPAPMQAEAGAGSDPMNGAQADGQSMGWTAGVLDAPEPVATVTGPVTPLGPPTAFADHAEIPGADDPAVDPANDPAADEASPEDAEDTRGEKPEELGGADLPEPEQLGGEDQSERPRRTRSLRSYTIQEVVRRRQIMLVQVTKEERGGKGAALTTYISLAGRYSVLMPNSPRGGGVSRKITSAADRRRLKEVTAESGLPDGMSLIIRTAGAARPKAEIARDIDYLLRTWDDIRETTLASVAPALIHEEASLIKRSVRDIYARDFEDILVDGQDGWRAARQFINTLIPGHAKKVQLWREPQKLFAKFGVDAQLDAIMQPRVQLRSGGYLVIDQTEALVAIDVNSGRSTRERNIEETAFRTNCEAAEEVARQLRLRDLAGLIVIDFIDMESRKNIGIVEKRLKDALHDDRARIQVGSISHFGLMEMSRQRLRPSVTEQTAAPCPHCGGTGHIRSNESAAINVLRQIEDEGAKRRAGEIVCHVATTVALYLLNNMRERVADIERRFAMRVLFSGDDALIPPEIRLDRTKPPSAAVAEFAPAPVDAELLDEADEAEDVQIDEEVSEGGETAEGEEGRERGRGRRRRRGRGKREDGAREETREDGSEPDALVALARESADGDAEPEDARTEVIRRGRQPVGDGVASDSAAETADAALGTGEPGAVLGEGDPVGEPGAGDDTPEGRERRRRRRGGRRRRRDGAGPDVSAPDAEQPDVPELEDPRGVPAYRGPTPADPFNNVPFDIFDVMEQAEAVEAARLRPAPPGAPPGAPPVAQEPVVLPSLMQPVADHATPERHRDATPPALPDAEPAEQSSDARRTPAPHAGPVLAEPVLAEPVSAEPVLVEPVLAEPVSVQPVLANPVSSGPVMAAAVLDPLPEPALPNAALPEPVRPEPALPEPVMPNPFMPEPVSGTPVRAEPVEGAKLLPTLVDALDGDAPRKRGWWRR